MFDELIEAGPDPVPEHLQVGHPIEVPGEPEGERPLIREDRDGDPDLHLVADWGGSGLFRNDGTLNMDGAAKTVIKAAFTNTAGANYRAVKKEIEEKQLLDRTVDLVKKARSLGVWVIHVTEGYTKDYRELDATNPGGFHRGQILRQAWKTGTEIQSYYPPLNPGPNDKDLVLPPRIQTSSFGGTGLNEILRARGIKNIAVAGFTTDVCVYATVTNGYDLGYHVFALKDAMVGYFPEQSELMLKNTYPMWSKVLSNDEWLNMLSAGAKISTR